MDSDSEASLIYLTKFLRPVFDNIFSLSLFLFLSQDTRRPRNMNKLDLNILDGICGVDPFLFFFHLTIFITFLTIFNSFIF